MLVTILNTEDLIDLRRQDKVTEAIARLTAETCLYLYSKDTIIYFIDMVCSIHVVLPIVFDL